MTTNKPEPIAWGIDPRKMSEADLLPCPACGNQAGKATKRAAKGLPFVGLWKVSCQRPECPLAMIYFHPVEWNQLPRIKQSDYDDLQAECEKLRQEVEALQGIQPEMPPMPPNGKGLPRYGVRWNGPTQPLSVPKDDGYWTPWHLAQAECEKLRSLIRHAQPIIRAHAEASHMLEGFRPRRNRWDELVEAIDAAMQEVKP